MFIIYSGDDFQKTKSAATLLCHSYSNMCSFAVNACAINISMEMIKCFTVMSAKHTRNNTYFNVLYKTVCCIHGRKGESYFYSLFIYFIIFIFIHFHTHIDIAHPRYETWLNRFLTKSMFWLIALFVRHLYGFNYIVLT